MPEGDQGRRLLPGSDGSLRSGQEQQGVARGLVPRGWGGLGIGWALGSLPAAWRERGAFGGLGERRGGGKLPGQHRDEAAQPGAPVMGGVVEHLPTAPEGAQAIRGAPSGLARPRRRALGAAVRPDRLVVGRSHPVARPQAHRVAQAQVPPPSVQTANSFRLGKPRSAGE